MRSHKFQDIDTPENVAAILAIWRNREFSNDERMTAATILLAIGFRRARDSWRRQYMEECEHSARLVQVPRGCDVTEIARLTAALAAMTAERDEWQSKHQWLMDRYEDCYTSAALQGEGRHPVELWNWIDSAIAERDDLSHRVCAHEGLARAALAGEADTSQALEDIIVSGADACKAGRCRACVATKERDQYRADLAEADRQIVLTQDVCDQVSKQCDQYRAMLKSISVCEGCECCPWCGEDPCDEDCDFDRVRRGE